jgi:DNA polymerase gamma 1
MAQQLAEVELPQMPDKWESGRAGWTKYNADGSMEQVRDLGGERMVSFDVETLYKLSPYPVMAVAASPTAWYSWLSPSIFQTQPVEEEEDRPVWDRTVPPHHPNQLIPLFPQPRLSFTGQTPRAASKDDQARLVIGHNVGYDRARVQDEYSLERTSTRWLDTLSLHVATHGITSVQRPAWQKYRKNKRQKLEREAEALAVMRDAAEEEGDVHMLAQLDAYALDMGFDGDTSDPTGGDGGAGSAAQAEASQKRWEDITSINSLAEVAALHCGYEVDKSVRNRFADDDVTHASQLLPGLDTLISYCAKDVQITHGVYRKVFPLFQQSCPHPASLSGVLSMGNSFLPVDENWEKYLQAAESKYREMDEGVRRALRVLAEKTRKEGRKEGDVWSEQLDWSEKRARWTEEVGQRAMKELLGDEYSATTGTDGTAEIKASSSETSETVLPADPVKIGPVAEEGETVEAQTQLPRPAWQVLLDDIDTVNSPRFARTTLPLLLQLSYKTYPVVYLQEHAWCFRVPEHLIGEFISSHSDSIHPGPKDKLVSANGLEEGFAFFRFDKEAKKTKLTGPGTAKLVRDGLLASNTVKGQEVLAKLGKSSGAIDESDVEALVEGMEKDRNSVWAKQLDWTAQGMSSCMLA